MIHLLLLIALAFDSPSAANDRLAGAIPSPGMARGADSSERRPVCAVSPAQFLTPAAAGETAMLVRCLTLDSAQTAAVKTALLSRDRKMAQLRSEPIRDAEIVPARRQQIYDEADQTVIRSLDSLQAGEYRAYAAERQRRLTAHEDSSSTTKPSSWRKWERWFPGSGRTWDDPNLP
jgi:hypothetical protein